MRLLLSNQFDHPSKPRSKFETIFDLFVVKIEIIKVGWIWLKLDWLKLFITVNDSSMLSHTEFSKDSNHCKFFQCDETLWGLVTSPFREDHHLETYHSAPHGVMRMITTISGLLGLSLAAELSLNRNSLGCIRFSTDMIRPLSNS